MRIRTFIKQSVLLSSFLVLMAFGPMLSIGAADQSVKGAMILAPNEALGTVASGAVEDTQKACLARIPDMATAGQRMLAEQSCKAEETSRKSLSLAPKF